MSPGADRSARRAPRRSAGLALAALVLTGGGSARAADNFQFANGGDWGAAHAAHERQFRVYDYRRSPAEPTLVSEVVLDRPLGKEAGWLVADDGSVWTFDGQEIARHGAGGSQTAVAPAVAGARIFRVLGPEPAVLYLQEAEGGPREMRCRLGPDLLRPDGPSRACTTRSAPPTQGSITRDLKRQLFVGVNTDVAIAQVIGCEPVAEVGRGTDAEVTYYALEAGLIFPYPAADGDGCRAALSPEGVWVRTQRKTASSPSVEPKPAALAVSADLGTVRFELPRPSEANLIAFASLRDPRRAHRPEAPRLRGLAVSPNGRFFILGDPSVPQPTARLSGPDLGIPPERLTQILASRAAKARAEGRHADADALTGEIEAARRPPPPTENAP